MSNPGPAVVAAAAPVRGSIELSDLQHTTSHARHGRHDSGYSGTTKPYSVDDHMPLSGVAAAASRDHSPADYNMSRTPRRSYEQAGADEASAQKQAQNPFISSKDAFTPSPSYPPTRSASAGDLTSTGNATPTNNVDLDKSTADLHNPLLSQSLLPVDGGKDAWLFLVGATVIEILVYGFSFSIGILHLYWTSMFGEENSSTVTLASTLQAGMLYMLLGIVGPILAAFPRYSKHLQLGGLVIASAGLIGTAFITQPWHLIVTIGMLFPFATATYMPCCILLFEWFQTRRGFAAGIMYAGTGVGGTIFPFIITGLIDRFGYRAAMCSIGIAFLAFGCLALIPIKRRIPLPRKARSAAAADGEGLGAQTEAETMRVPRPNLSFMRRPQVWIGAGIILVSSMGTFVPTLWLPSFADDLKVSPGGTGLISIMNAASVPGNTLIGYLSDRYPIHTVIIGNCAISSLVCFFLWGFGTNAGTLVTFVIFFGLVGLSFAALWTRMLGLIARDDPTVPAVAFSIFAVGRGIGSVTSGPIADALLKVDVLRGAAGGYGVKNYGILLIYTGASIMVAAAMGFAFTDKQRK